jgi:outer membrane receptor for ferrienterochelin and colicins
VCALWLGALCCGRACAQDDAGAPPEHNADATSPAASAPDGAPAESPALEVVVTGTRIDEPLKQSAVATQVITRAQIEQSGARNLAELLRNSPALNVQESFRGTELWMRGLDPEYTLILIDGERVPGRIGGAFDLSRFGVERIERVEIQDRRGTSTCDVQRGRRDHQHGQHGQQQRRAVGLV